MSNYHIEVLDSQARDILPKSTLLVVSADSIQEAASQAEELAKHTSNPSYIVTTEFTDPA